MGVGACLYKINKCDCFPIGLVHIGLCSPYILLLDTGWLTDWLDDLEELTVNSTLSSTFPGGYWIYEPIKNPLQTDDLPTKYTETPGSGIDCNTQG